MMFGDVSQQFRGGALLPDDDHTAVLALGLSLTDLGEVSPSSAGIVSVRRHSSGRAENIYSRSITKFYKMKDSKYQYHRTEYH